MEALTWEQRFSMLVAFCKINRCLPGPGTVLHRWCVRQRELASQNNLLPERLELLRSVPEWRTDLEQEKLTDTQTWSRPRSMQTRCDPWTLLNIPSSTRFDTLSGMTEEKTDSMRPRSAADPDPRFFSNSIHKSYATLNVAHARG